MIEYGKERSPTMNDGSEALVGATEAPHQASSSSSAAAPCDIAMSIGLPRLPGAPDGEPSMPWYLRRQSRLWSNPPAASITPRRAPIVTCRPSRVTRTPTTRPSSTTRSSSGDSSQSSALFLITTASRNEEVRPAPMPASFAPRTRPPATRKTSWAPRRKPLGVDQARPSSQTSSVRTGSAAGACVDFHQSPILRTSKGLCSMARPILPPGRSG